MIKVAMLQRGNKVLEYLSSLSWSFDASCCGDYEINFSTLVLFLSLKFHAAKPEYIHKRISKLKPAKLRVLLILIDTPNYNSTLQELFKNVTIPIILCKSYEECGKYIKGFDICSKRSSEVLRRKDSTIETFLEAFPKVNKTDANTLQKTFSSVQDLFNSAESKLPKVFGFSKLKSESFVDILNKPFKNESSQQD